MVTSEYQHLRLVEVRSSLCVDTAADTQDRWEDMVDFLRGLVVHDSVRAAGSTTACRLVSPCAAGAVEYKLQVLKVEIVDEFADLG